MSSVLKPRDEADAEQAVAWAVAERKTLEIVGAGTKRAVGRLIHCDHTFDLGDLAGVRMYEPAELVLTAGAGTPLAEIEAALAAQGQELAFEPPQLAGFLGTGEVGATIGGIVSANLAGPRRMKAGAARDHVLGLRAITGRSETLRIGGRVVKNVTGYDMCKLLTGAWGTLSVLTEVTLKVLPKAEAEETVLLTGLGPERAVAAMSEASASAADISGAAHLPASLAARSQAPGIAALGTSVTALRLEGLGPAMATRRDILVAALERFGPAESLKGDGSAALWREIRDVALFPEGIQVAIWRISTPPARGAAVAASAAIIEEVEALYDWGGGLVWLAQPAYGDGGAAAIRAVVRRYGGHATLYRAGAAVRNAVAVFEPQGEEIAALTRRLKAAFDPHAIFNPGRMYPGV